MSTNNDSWGSRIGLILAMAGNAVGFGNFLRFPVKAMQNGGGAFIIPYLVCFLLMGIPLLYVEWASGRFGGKHGHHSTPFILGSMHAGRIWKYIGVFGIFTNLAGKRVRLCAGRCRVLMASHSLWLHSGSVGQTRTAVK